MQHATRKLKSTRGASLIFALLVFMLCIFAGVAALTAAAANIGRYTHLEYEQQQYLSVASALELLQSQLDAEAKTPAATTVTVTYTETKTWWYCPDGAGIPQRYDDQAYTLNVTDKDGNVLDPDTLGFYQVQLLEQFVPQAWRENVDSTTYSTARPDAGGGGNLAPWPTWSASTTFADKKYEIAIKNDPAITEWDPETLLPVTATVKPVKAADGTADPWKLEMDLITRDGGAYPLKVVWQGEATETTVSETTDTSKTSYSGTVPAGLSTFGRTDWGSYPGTSYGQTVTKVTKTLCVQWPAANRTITFE